MAKALSVLCWNLFYVRAAINPGYLPPRIWLILLKESEFIAEFVKECKNRIDNYKYTFFEVNTALAFLYFAEKRVELAVVETGLGGRLDATNVLLPLATVITNIDLEHTDILGQKITQIAAEKAGI